MIPADSFCSSGRPALWCGWNWWQWKRGRWWTRRAPSWITPPTQSMTNTGRWATHSAPSSSHHIAKMELFRRSLVPAAIRRHNSKCDTFPNPLPLSQNSQAQCSYLSNGPNIQTLTTENGLSLLSNDAWTLSMNCILVMVTVITEDQDTHCVLFLFFFFFCHRSLWQPLEPVLQCRHKVKRWRCIHIIYNFWIVRLSEMK